MAPAPISSAIGEAVYWLVWLLFLPAILSVLGLTGILLPIQAMLTSLLGVLPSLLAAAIIIIVGLFVARILQRIVASALHAFGVDALSERVGVAKYLGKPGLSGLIGYLVYIIVLIPVLIAALNVTGPDLPGRAAVGHAQPDPRWPSPRSSWRPWSWPSRS